MSDDVKTGQAGGFEFYYPIALGLYRFKNSHALIEKILKETGDETKILAEKINRIVEENGVLAETNREG